MKDINKYQFDLYLFLGGATHFSSDAAILRHAYPWIRLLKEQKYNRFKSHDQKIVYNSVHILRSIRKIFYFLKLLIYDSVNIF